MLPKHNLAISSPEDIKLFKEQNIDETFYTPEGLWSQITPETKSIKQAINANGYAVVTNRVILEQVLAELLK